MKTLLLFRSSLKRFQKRFYLLGFCILIKTFFEGLGLGLFIPLLDYLQNRDISTENSQFGFVFKFIEDLLGTTLSVEIFIFIIFMAQATAVIAGFVTQLVSVKTYYPINLDVRTKAFSNILSFPMSYFVKNNSGRLCHTLEGEVEHVGRSIDCVVLMLVDSLFIIVYLSGAFMLSWPITLLVVAVGAIRYNIVGFFLKEIRRINDSYTRIIATLKSYIIGVYQGIDIIKTSATEGLEAKRFTHISENFKHAATRGVIFSQLSVSMEMLTGYFLLCIIIYLSIEVFKVPGANLMVLLFIVVRVIPKVAALNDARVRFAEYTSRIVFLKEIFDKTSWRAEDDHGTHDEQDFHSKIRIESVSFTYPGSEHTSLKNINLEIPKNKTLALVGESGSGKTSLARLLLRLYQPDSGKITLDGRDAKEISRLSWLKLFSVISQDTFIFDDTIENNIKYGSSDCSEEDFRYAIERARAAEFIDRLPNKEKELIGERGIKLSGGQRQRIAIARAFLRASPVLILDEATSALDSVTENLIQQALEDLSKNKTLVVIAHRLSTVQNADRIVVLEGGQIVQSGLHHELLASEGPYQRFYNLQILKKNIPTV